MHVHNVGGPIGEDNMEKSFVPTLAKLLLPSRQKLESEQEFLQRIAQECRRAERSGQRFLLVLIEGFEARLEHVPAITCSLSALIREMPLRLV